MEPDINVTIGTEVREQDIDNVEQVFDGLFQLIKELAHDAWSSAGEEARAYAMDAASYLEEGFDESKVAIKSTLKDAIKGSLGPLFEGEMDDVEEVWEKAWVRMGDSLDSIWQGLLGQLENSIMTGLGTTTTAAYKSMIGSAGGFFDQVTYGTNTVLKKLLIGEVSKQNQTITGVRKAADDYMAIAA